MPPISANRSKPNSAVLIALATVSMLLLASCGSTRGLAEQSVTAGSTVVEDGATLSTAPARPTTVSTNPATSSLVLTPGSADEPPAELARLVSPELARELSQSFGSFHPRVAAEEVTVLLIDQADLAVILDSYMPSEGIWSRTSLPSWTRWELVFRWPRSRDDR